MLKPAARRAWIAQYLLNRQAATQTRHTVDVLDANFVAKYIDASIIGADRCPTLGRDLGAMYAEGVLRRQSCGFASPTAGGWPKWVWVYWLANPQAEALKHGTTFGTIIEHVRTTGKHFTFSSSAA